MAFIKKNIVYFFPTKSRFKDRGPFDQKSVDRNCVFSVDQNFHNQLTEFFETFQLIKKFNQLSKSEGSFVPSAKCQKITCKFD